MIFNKIQTLLDNLLYKDKVFSFWNRAKEVESDQNTKEYVVYSQSDSPTGISADNKPLTRNIGVTVRYYYDQAFETSHTGRSKVQKRANDLLLAMELDGFETTTGIMWMGDIDSVGKSVAVMDFIYTEVRNGN